MKRRQQRQPIVLLEVRQDAPGPVVTTVIRTPTPHAGWQSVRYDGRRYQVFGGIRGPLFIDLSNPIQPSA